MTVIVTGGDGDGYGIGVGHFVHSMRRNLDITYIVMDNQIYGLTTGSGIADHRALGENQVTPGRATWKASLNPIALALAGGASFVARGFSGEPMQLAEIYKKAIQHKGFALVDVFQPLRHL